MFKSETRKFEGVYQIKIDVPFDVKFVYVYIWEIDGKKVMFDAGLNMGNWGRLFFSELQKINLSIEDIDYCIISHHHLDHLGLLKKFKRKNPKIQILMGEITHDTIEWETDTNNAEELKEVAKKLAQKMIKFGISEGGDI